MPVQVSSTAAMCHLPQFFVVPDGTVAPAGGGDEVVAVPVGGDGGGRAVVEAVLIRDFKCKGVCSHYRIFFIFKCLNSYLNVTFYYVGIYMVL